MLSNNTINEIKGGLNANYYTLEPIAGWGTTGSRRPPDTAKILFGVFSGREIEGGAPRSRSPATRLARRPTTPQRTGEHNYQIRDDFTTAFELGGRHDVKMGGDFIKYTMSQGWCNVCDGLFTSTSRAAGQPRAAAARLARCVHLELDRDVAAVPRLQRDHRQHVVFGAPRDLRGVVPGRLEGRQQADAEHGRSLRPRSRRAGRVREVPAVAVRQASDRQEQPRAAARLRVLRSTTSRSSAADGACSSPSSKTTRCTSRTS